MARYSALFKAVNSVHDIRQVLADTLAACDLNLIYANDEYLVAKEKPGGVTPAKLATVEVLINPPTVEEPSARVNLVVKNEELALKADNHCHRIFDLVNRAISDTDLATLAL